MSGLTFLLFKLNTLHKAGKIVDNKQKHLNYLENEKFKIRNLTFQNTYSPSSCFPGVLRNCIINKRINLKMSASDKSSNSESAEAMV